ncbi:phage tail protein [Aeromonas salmonicida]|nr:phage tail protein [Aeromonas salmonicida]ORJ13794.1 permease [Aeromonas salmonicida]ORJ15477.1 permease [Aeromonas salmonicida]WCH32871.1 phage tail protein [Aeromonas salmonicida]WCH37081.1 phage tail protein [Aeromonas salmonicida]WGI37843.1 phage tail protein [Aeromonas salmonicida]
MAAILNRGMILITQNLALNRPTHISQVVLAYKPGLVYTDPVNPDEADPSADELRFEGSVTRAAAISPDKVVYSLMLTPTEGSFTFNWMGLRASDGTLVAVSYLPDTVKVAKDEHQAGDTMIRNFILAFGSAAASLDVTVTPETWQFDFTDYIQAELDKLWLGQTVSQNTLARRGGQYRFMAHATLTLDDALPPGTQLRVLVDHSVNLYAGQCVVAHSRPIIAPRGADTQLKLIESGREFLFINIDHQWRVS